MTSPIKKTPFKELHETLIVMCKKIDEQFTKLKVEKKGKKAYDGFDSFKALLRHVELTAIKDTAKELKLGESTVRERWKILTLPLPAYDALESNKVTLSRLKPLTSIVFDIENSKDIEIAQRLVDEIKKDISLDEIKELVKKEAGNIWNSHTVLMELMAKQNGVIYSTVC